VNAPALKRRGFLARLDNPRGINLVGVGESPEGIWETLAGSCERAASHVIMVKLNFKFAFTAEGNTSPYNFGPYWYMC
jgi:hypothetical protein